MADQPGGQLDRRRVLQGTGAGVATLMAGCLGGGGNGNDDGNGNGGGGGTPNPADGPDVHFLTDYSGDIWENKWESLSSQFTEETDIGVRVEYSGQGAQGQSRLSTLMQAGNPPDVNTSTFSIVADIWASDQLETTTEVVDQIEGVAGDLLATPYMDGDTIWQVPHGYYTVDFQYREDVYEELGLSVPTSFQGVVDNARAIDNSNMDIRGYGLAGGKVGKSQDEFQAYLSNMGVSGVGLRYKDPDARNELEVWWPEEEITTLLEFFNELQQYSPDPTGIGWTSSIQNYLGGQFAQQFHLNSWPAGIAANADIDTIAYNTGIAPLPYWEAGGVSKGDSWLYEPVPDGYHVISGGDNISGGKEWLAWLYGGNIGRTAGMYAQEPSRFLPVYSDVLSSDPFQNIEFWSQGQNQKLLDQLQFTQDTIVGEHYGQVPESNLNDPVEVYVRSQWFFGEMVNRVITGTSSVQETYEWGRQRLETRLEEGRNRFR